MKTSVYLLAVALSSLSLVGVAQARALQDQVDHCLERHANNHDSATVTLQCTAGGGKLSDCKVVDNTTPGKGFDKAALCVAENLPMGSKAGEVKVPIRFSGAE